MLALNAQDGPVCLHRKSKNKAPDTQTKKNTKKQGKRGTIKFKKNIQDKQNACVLKGLARKNERAPAPTTTTKNTEKNSEKATKAEFKQKSPVKQNACVSKGWPEKTESARRQATSQNDKEETTPNLLLKWLEGFCPFCPLCLRQLALRAGEQRKEATTTARWDCTRKQSKAQRSKATQGTAT